MTIRATFGTRSGQELPNDHQGSVRHPIQLPNDHQGSVRHPIRVRGGSGARGRRMATSIPCVSEAEASGPQPPRGPGGEQTAA